MENIYEQIDKMINREDERPSWADEILNELKEIKELLSQNRKTSKKRDNREYFITAPTNILKI